MIICYPGFRQAVVDNEKSSESKVYCRFYRHLGLMPATDERREQVSKSFRFMLKGRMVIPVGTQEQEILVLTKTQDSLIEERTIPVRFVPMTGKH